MARKKLRSDARPGEGEYSEAVANGGFLTHIKETGKYAALCGHSPSSPKGHQFSRGRWRTTRKLDIDAERTRWCKKCRDKWEKLKDDEGTTEERG